LCRMSKSSLAAWKCASYSIPNMASKNDAWHGIVLSYFKMIDAMSGIVFWRHVWRQKACTFPLWEPTFAFDSTIQPSPMVTILSLSRGNYRVYGTSSNYLSNKVAYTVGIIYRRRWNIYLLFFCYIESYQLL